MICSIFGIVLTLGLAYSYKVRCVVLMLLPQLFSKRGRQALTAYAFILVLTGPAKNTLHNMRMLSESLACGQAKLKSAIKSVVDIIKEPLKAIRTSMEYIMKKVKEIVVKVKAMISSLKKAILAILGVLKAGFDWLNSVVSICSKKMGTPYQRCSKVFDDAVIDCKAKLGPLFDWMCSATYMVKAVCYTVKVLDFICEVIEFVGDEVVMKVKKKFREFSYRLRNVFYVSIDFSHSFELKSNQSKSVREITAGIATEIRQRTSGLLYLFDWMSFVFSFFFLYIIFQTITYKRKFLTQEWYDNRFLTDDIVMLDMKRAYLGKETILPLNFHEKKKYISFTSWRLVSNERKRLAKTAIFLTVATIKLSIHMMTDYSLYWILNMIRYHGQFQSNLDAPSKVEVRVSGKGVVAELFSSIINAFQPAGIKNEFDTVPCLPDPRPPDIGRYKQIVSLVILTWILAVTEPYGLRLRNYVMCYYYPVAARQRAVWLYNHILRSRGSFLKFARRQLRRKFGKGVSYGVEMEKFSCMDRLRALCPSLERFFPGTKDKCLLCGTPATPNSPLIYCPTPGCQGKFCNNCYATMKNICTLCKTPVEYGDISDISEEK
ncbi:hypothetical protein O3M35_009368 [Rhynocoris fuscipes]|uniref:DC-STAMP domain-containing protein 2 n=1 Tax=Rhynocoris fuscipes TaxID=488301 RepID=A0AAW1D816_9HEMI